MVRRCETLLSERTFSTYQTKLGDDHWRKYELNSPPPTAKQMPLMQYVRLACAKSELITRYKHLDNLAVIVEYQTGQNDVKQERGALRERATMSNSRSIPNTDVHLVRLKEQLGFNRLDMSQFRE